MHEDRVYNNSMRILHIYMSKVGAKPTWMFKVSALDFGAHHIIWPVDILKIDSNHPAAKELECYEIIYSEDDSDKEAVLDCRTGHWILQYPNDTRN